MNLVSRNWVRGIAWGILLSSVLAAAQSATLVNPQFLCEVTIQNERVRLADLLAPSAIPQLRAISSVDLGRAPEPGSFRVFTAAELHDVMGSSLALEVPAQVIVHRTGWPVSSQRITAALAAAKLPASNVGILGAPVTRTRDALLEVSAMRPVHASDTLLVRFACRIRSDCNPFWGEIRGAENAAPPEPHRNSSLVQSLPSNPLVKPGHPALLVCTEPGMEIRLRVNPLKPAALGERVKVLDPETHRIFFARVKADNLVESDLEEAR